MAGSSGGVYHVGESGVKLHHVVSSDSSTPRDGSEFLARFVEGFEMRVLDQPSAQELIFEMVGVDASFANALRRILIAEVPTMAIETVYIWDNTSIVHDEVLSHRLGLVPLDVDPRYFDFFEDGYDEEDGKEGRAGQEDEDEDGGGDNATDRNTLVFKLSVSCRSPAAKRAPGDAAMDTATTMEDSVLGNTELDEAAAEAAAALRDAIETPGRPHTQHVYSRDLEWVPQGDQDRRFPEGVRPVHEDILLAKLRPGQRIELEAHARKGNGKDHAKYSPVATASYRLMPDVQLLKPVYDDLARELVNLYEPGVFTLVETDSNDAPGTQVKAQVTNPYACTMSRNFMRHPELVEAIKITRRPDHFIFSVESVGMYRPGVLVAEALRILQNKCDRLKELANESLGLGEDDEDQIIVEE